MRIAFLDIDGVLNHPGTYADRRPDDGPIVPVDPACMARLNQLLARTGASVVISSSWRLHASWEILGAMLAERGLAGTVIGQTPDPIGDAVLRTRAVAGLPIERGMEIAAWLARHPEAASLAILDDGRSGHGAPGAVPDPDGSRDWAERRRRRARGGPPVAESGRRGRGGSRASPRARRERARRSSGRRGAGRPISSVAAGALRRALLATEPRRSVAMRVEGRLLIGSERIAVGIYVAMARDAGDALDEIGECDDRRALETLLAMLDHPGGDETDRDLNGLFADQVRIRIVKLPCVKCNHEITSGKCSCPEGCP